MSFNEVCHGRIICVGISSRKGRKWDMAASEGARLTGLSWGRKHTPGDVEILASRQPHPDQPCDSMFPDCSGSVCSSTKSQTFSLKSCSILFSLKTLFELMVTLARPKCWLTFSSQHSSYHVLLYEMSLQSSRP